MFCSVKENPSDCGATPMEREERVTHERRRKKVSPDKELAKDVGTDGLRGGGN